MSKQDRAVGSRVGLGLLAVQLVNVPASIAIRLGYQFPAAGAILLLVVDVVVAALFVLMSSFIASRVARRKNIAINRFAFVYLVAATVQVIVHIALLVSSGEPKQDSLLWGLWVLGGAYLLLVAVFTGWYWLYDHVTPGGAFVFPEDSLGRDGVPNLVDYLFISFNTNSTFGPTTEVVRSRQVKVLMMLQTLMSLLILLVFVGRMVNASR